MISSVNLSLAVESEYTQHTTRRQSRLTAFAPYTDTEYGYSYSITTMSYDAWYLQGRAGLTDIRDLNTLG